jgi:hypothetical protein
MTPATANQTGFFPKFFPMKTTPALIALITTVLGSGTIRAQKETAALSPEELASRRSSVVNLEKHIEQRQERLGEIVTDIRALDDRVEDGVGEIVTMMSPVKDSETSKVRIANIKVDVIVGLKRTIDYYNQHRDTLREELRTGNSSLPKETLEKDLAIFDARIDKLLPSTSYTFRVQAINGDGLGSLFGPQCYVTTAMPSPGNLRTKGRLTSTTYLAVFAQPL